MTSLSGVAEADWAEVLERLDAAVDAAWRALGAGDATGLALAVDELDQRSALPTLPEAMGGRARDVLARLGALDALLEAARAEVGRELAIAHRLAPATRAVPRFIDRTA